MLMHSSSCLGVAAVVCGVRVLLLLLLLLVGRGLVGAIA
jgi:hypothetical protein